MTTDKNKNDASKDAYAFKKTAPLRTVDVRSEERPPTPEALAVLQTLVNETDDAGNAISSDMPAPHFGERFSQRQLARKILAGRSYQAVQAWLAGSPVPNVTAQWFTEDLQWVDARQSERVIRLQDDEIAIIVKR